MSMSDCEGLKTGGRRRRCSSPPPASPLENDDMLSEILLHLPPAPSSLPRSSAVCKLWRRLVSDPAFLRRFHARHRRSPPLLGFFSHGPGGISFTPTLEPPDCIPPEYFSLPLDRRWIILCCRHGLVLLYMQTQLQVLVWDPVIGDRYLIALPPKLRFDKGGLFFMLNGAVLRAVDNVNGGEHSSNFKVVLVGVDKELTEVCAYVYSSDSGMWGDIISTACSSKLPVDIPATLVGGSLYWLLYVFSGSGIDVLELDLDRQCLSVIKLPPQVSSLCDDGQIRVMRSEGGELGFLFLSSSSIQLWKRVADSDGGARWVLGRTIDICKLLSVDPAKGLTRTVRVFGFDEDDNVLLLRTRVGPFMIKLEPMQLKKPFQMNRSRDKINIGIFNKLYHPFTCVYTPGMRVEGKHDGVELWQNA